MNFRGDSAEQRRPSSDNLVDLHISVVPMEHWVERLNYASHQIIGETFSAGFLRVFPDTLVSSIRGEIKNQLGTDILPKEYVFLKHVGRCLALVRQKQETELKVKNFLPPHSIMPEIFVLPGKPTMYTYSVLPPIKPNNTINNEDINSKSELQQSQKYIDSLSASYNNTPQPVQENVKKNAIPLPKSAHKSPAKSQVPNLQRKTDIKRQKRHVSGKSSYENEQKTNSTEKVTNMRRGPTSPGQVSDEFGGMTAKEQMVVVAHQSQQQFDDQNPNLAKSTLHDGPKKRRVRYNMPDINQSNASSQEFDDYNMHDNHLVANGYEPDPKSIPFNSNQDPYNNKAWQEYDNPQNSHENPILMRSQIQPSDPQTKDHLDNFRDNFDPLNDPKFMENVDLPADLQNFDLKGRENFHPLGDSESSSVRPEFMTPSNPKGNFPTVKPNSMNEDSGYVDNSDSDEFTNQGYERIDPRTKISREKNSQINQQQNDRVWQLNTELNKQSGLLQPDNSGNNFKQTYQQDNYRNDDGFSNQSDNNSQNNEQLSHHDSKNNLNYERQINPPLEIFDRNHDITFNQQNGQILSQDDTESAEINETGSKVSYRLSQQGYYMNSHEDAAQNNYENQENYNLQENSQYYDDGDTDESNYESDDNDDFQNELRSFMQTQSQDFMPDHETHDASQSHDDAVNQNVHEPLRSHDGIKTIAHEDLNMIHEEVNETVSLNANHAMSSSHEALNGDENNTDVIIDSGEGNFSVNNSHSHLDISHDYEKTNDDDLQNNNISDEIHDSPSHDHGDIVDYTNERESYHDNPEPKREVLGSINGQSQHEEIPNEEFKENLNTEKPVNENLGNYENTKNNGNPVETVDDAVMLPRQPLEGIEMERRESLSGSSERKGSSPIIVTGFVAAETTANNPLEGDISNVQDKVSRGAPDGMPTQRKVNTGGDKKPDKVYPELDEETASVKDQPSTAVVGSVVNVGEKQIETGMKLEDEVKQNEKISPENKAETLEDVKIGIRNQPSATNVDSNPSPSPIRIPQFNKPAVERHNNTPSPVIPKTPKKTTENRVSKEVTKGTARITTVSQKGENGVRLGSPDRSKLWSNLQRIRSERRTSEKQRQDLVRQAKVTTSKMNQKRTSVTVQMERMFPRIHSSRSKKPAGPGERCSVQGCYYVFHTKQDKKRHFGLVHRGISTVRDMWKKKFFEEKKKATPLEETCKRLQVELDTTHQRLVSAMEGGAPRVAMPPQKFPAFLPHIGNAPSLKNNSKIQVTRLQHNMDNLRRRIEDAKIKLTGEIKLRHQAEQQVKSVRQELLAKKIQCHLAYREVVRGHAFQPTIRSKA